MSDTEPPVALAVDHLKVDKVSIWNSTDASVLVKLTPLLSVAITAVALIVTSCIQLWQGSTGNNDRIDTAWRGVLEKVTLEDRQAIVASLELQTFFGDKRYGKQARALAAVVLPKVTDPNAFDTALDGMSEGGSSMSERHFVTMARTVTNELHNLYDIAMVGQADAIGSREDAFKDFVANPEKFLDDKTQSTELHAALSDTWKLDSICGILREAWDDPRTRQIPEDTDLSGIAFVNYDFSKVDFRKANMDNSTFLGHCKVRQEWLPNGVPVRCDKP